jgi:iron-sulfur cluster assembly accessory protein
MKMAATRVTIRLGRALRPVRSVSQAIRTSTCIATTQQSLIPSLVVPTTSYRSMVMVTQTKADHGSGENLVASNDDQKKSSPHTSLPTPTTVPADDTHQSQLLVTDSCWNRVRTLAARKQQSLDDVYLRVFVDAGGCSGFTYQFELDQEALAADDVVFVQPHSDGNGTARVVVDETSLNYIRGSTINYVQEMIKSSFEVQENPQSESACGCGSSFALKNFAANPALD